MLTHQLIKRTIDLNKTIYREMLGNVFVTKDAKAHRFELTLTRGSNPLSLADENVSATLVALDHGITVDGNGSVESGKAVFVMPEEFYQFDGRFYLYIHTSYGTERATPFVAEGTMLLGETETHYDPDSLIPSVSEVLAQLEAARAAANAANAAAASIENMTVGAVEGATVGAVMTNRDGVKHIEFSLPKGPKGDTGESQPYNWLINSDWREPARVDSEQSALGSGYWLLGWKGDSSISTAEVDNGYVTIGNTGSGYGGVSQYIAPGRIAGKTMTMVVYTADGNAHLLTGSITTALSASQAAGDGLMAMSYDSNAGAYRFRIFTAAGKSLRVKAVALYEGALTVAPPYEPKGGADLIEMAKQYIVTASGTSGYCTSTAAYVRIPIPTKMRVVPSIENVELGSVRVGGKNITPTGISINGMDDNIVRVALSYPEDSTIINQIGAWTGSCSLNAYVVP